ncbi:LicD family protein [Bovifimicola ammoniilytica]|jgi:lipopolysaccharide cholinephosphotransferase|uniref:LicD family protein n=1 Tax=Bovifimicola ammoniilytica TaxID=2981720 RepID=UPI00034059BE|nr:LicD family protein [Bovifimicola ammoniilytica]MCU6753494.1 LicD family protein [Bovifimicola ammoniilytica]CCZ03860.1 lICD family protein [Eubacterium sp. CAG:603]SCJ65345.1 LPS biosynthesis protein [uncultured Eubacterium sp.]
MVDLKIELPDGFLEEEVRCDYTVTKDIKEVWAIEIDLLMQLDEVCKKHNLKYYITDGTMLGTVRHKGFIPWDDDIDVTMFRDDYEKLLKVAETEFKYPYFLQTEYSDPGCLRGHAQLRNSATTGILKTEEGKFKFNQGLFLDVFVMDNVIDDKKLYEQQKKDAEKYRKRAVKYARWSTRYYKQNTWQSKVKGILYPVVNTFLRKTKLEEKNFRKFEEVCKRYNNMETKYVTTLEFSFDIERWGKRLKSYFDKVEYMPFEFIKLPISVDYDEMLRNDYGDYMVFKKGASAHGDMIIDTDRSYTEYINKITKDKSGNK